MKLNNNRHMRRKSRGLRKGFQKKRVLEPIPIMAESEAGQTEIQNIELESGKSSNTKLPKSILVATSIGPNRIELQKAAIDTWLKVGFNVVSLNTKEEVEMLQKHFPNIQFHIVERSAKERYGKPYVYIYDFMRYLDSADYKVCGIINSDIHFKGVQDNFIDFIYQEALNSLVYGHRLDVNNINDSYGTLSNGVDYFFFDKELISIYKDDGLCMGQPAWDWWMVCVAASEHIPTKRVLSKIALHQIHPQFSKSILVATSIGPNRIELQKAAIDTWLKVGFNVVSLNTKEEVEMLQKHFPNVQFHIVERSAKERYGKPYVYIYDFMRYLDSADYKVCGIINSDIHFKGVQDNFIDFIYQEALNSLVYGHRLDVNNINDSYGTLSNGVDYFFFDKELISIYKDDGLCMGQPAWDWWMVCVAASEHIPTKRVLSKIALHQIHPQEWYESLNQYLIESIVFKRYLQKLYPDASKSQLNSKMWEIVISKSGIEYKLEEEEYSPALIDHSNEVLDTLYRETKIPVISNRENIKPILVATSIGPNKIDIQRSAINTWLYAGFNVVSLNTSEEIDTLKPYFPDIEFHAVERSAKEKFGKPYIYIYDFMRYLNSTDYNVVGIINSDIHFKDVKQYFVNVIYKEALGSLVYGHRMDVNHINDSFGTVSTGIDYFFFDKNLIPIYQDDGLCMGQPAWDWWMVCVPASEYKTTKRILNPIGYHVIHPQQWDQSLNEYLIKNIVMKKYLRKIYPDVSFNELNSKMWEMVISKSGIEIK